MELANQIKKYRGEKRISQEELAERIYVSRQTISSWENDKSYPDVNSLIRLSEVFEVSLDTLIKGDLTIMREEIKSEEIRSFKNWGWLYAAMLIVDVIAVVPLWMQGKWGIVAWAIINVATFAVAFKLEHEKKKHNLKSYKQIVAFMDGKHLDELENAYENGKAKYQSIVFALVAGVIAFIVTLIISIVAGVVFFN